MKPIIKVENIAKQYHVDSARTPHTSLREYLTDSARSSVGKVKEIVASRGRRARNAENSFWALNDVSFEVAPGEVVGIIGRNGAGKSTLLKILSRITEPTRGRIKLYGRVGSLLEVGTGFHPDLSGRENVFLNGAILGMKRSEITAKFDEIVAFAELERFIDTPVKRYSSGMYTRLAFAVAAHLEPEILIVDEVLAVGDAAFQKKCLGKMSDVAKDGRTVLFVSHNFEAVKTLCKRSVLLEQGQIIEDSTPIICIARALAKQRESISPTAFRVREHPALRDKTDIPQPCAIEVKAVGKHPGDLITFNDDIVATLYLDSPVREQHTFALQVITTTGTHIFNSFYRDDDSNPPLRPGSTREVSVVIPRCLLPGGIYEVSFAYMLPNAELFWVTYDTWFETHEIETYRNKGLTVNRTGLIAIVLPWSNDNHVAISTSQEA